MNNRKKARKFNIIDFILIVFIAAAAAVLFYVMLGNLVVPVMRITCDIDVCVRGENNPSCFGWIAGPSHSPISGECENLVVRTPEEGVIH